MDSTSSSLTDFLLQADRLSPRPSSGDAFASRKISSSSADSLLFIRGGDGSCIGDAGAPAFLPAQVNLKGGVVVYPVMQVYGSLTSEDNSEVGEAMLVRCSISAVFNRILQALPLKWPP